LVLLKIEGLGILTLFKLSFSFTLKNISRVFSPISCVDNRKCLSLSPPWPLCSHSRDNPILVCWKRNPFPINFTITFTEKNFTNNYFFKETITLIVFLHTMDTYGTYIAHVKMYRSMGKSWEWNRKLYEGRKTALMSELWDRIGSNGGWELTEQQGQFSTIIRRMPWCIC
jgi:hypothetical protein